MKDSVVLEWLDENRRRAFPLQENPNGPSSDIIVDAYMLNAIAWPSHLKKIVVVAGVSVKIYVTDIVGFYVNKYTFNLPLTTDYSTAVNDVIVGVFDDMGYDVPADSPYAGMCKLTVSSAINNLPTGTTNYTGVNFEYDVGVSYGGNCSGVSSLSFTAFAEDLGLLNGYYLQLMSGDTLGLIAGSVPFVGDIAFYGRYQTKLDAKNNSLIWTVGKNHGTPLPACAPYGADDCGTQVSYINGISPVTNAFTFKTGSGIKVTPDKINHTLTFALDFSTADICVAIPPTP